MIEGGKAPRKLSTDSDSDYYLQRNKKKKEEKNKKTKVAKLPCDSRDNEAHFHKYQ